MAEAAEPGDVERLQTELEELREKNRKLERRGAWRARLRRAALVLLLVLGCGLAAVSAIGIWTRVTVLNTDNYVETVAPLAQSPAVQDAVATANILAEPLRRRAVTIETLRDVQRRREFPTRFTQRLQILAQNNIIGPALMGRRPKAPFFMKMLQWPLLRRIPGRLLALGIRPEHVRTADMAPATRGPAS